MTKEYDMVMNCRPELWKKPYLAEKINELAYIKGATYGFKEKYDFTKLNCKFMNEKLIPMNNVIDIYNKSFCGGIFSEKEGACYSSSEYLLCGLPVISTVSRGGRDTWYNQTNSIICQDNAEDVKKCVELCITLCNDGTFNRNKIRNDHIKLSDEMRNNFIQYTKIIFIENGIDMNADDYFNKIYFHKMKNNIKSEIIINSYLN
jgi:glycosyltransferase involved in cell wall biosynthesis